MLEAVGLAEPALQTVARMAYHTLGLQSYFTVVKKRFEHGRFQSAQLLLMLQA